MRKSNIIQRLNNLDLHSCKDQDIVDLIDNNQYVLQFFIVPPGQAVYRATVLTEEEEKKGIECITRERLSYLPAKNNNKYQRASIPGHTMFYGILPNMEKDNNYVCSGIMAALFETSQYFREITFQTEWHMHVVSEWVNTRPITLLAIADPYLNNKSSRLNECAENYRSIVKADFPSALVEDEIMFQNYIFNQFTTPIEEDCQYRISALFATRFLEEAKKQGKDVDGLIWQSAINKDVKLKDALCVAILPETIDNSFKKPNHFSYVEEFNGGQIKLKLWEL